MGEFTSLVNAWIANKKTKNTIKNIELNNELRKNISQYEPGSFDGLIRRDQNPGSYIVSGGSNSNRVKVTKSIIEFLAVSRVPIVILHEGNMEMKNAVTTSSIQGVNKYMIDINNSIYDPFYNRTNQEISNLILNSSKKGYEISPIGQHYIFGIAEFIKSKRIPPYYEMFANCPHDILFDKLEEAKDKGYLENEKASLILNQLMQGQVERANIQSFFSTLIYQGNNIFPDNHKRDSVVNVKAAVNQGGLIMVDIGSSTNEVLINLIMNEILEVLAKGNKLMLVIDGINISANNLLAKVIKSQSARCLTTLISEDIYSMIGAEEKVFQSLVGSSSKCIIYSQSIGVSSSKWSDVIGYYDADKVSHDMGSNKNYQWGYGFGSSNSINIVTNREYILKPEELSKMMQNEVYIIDRNTQELAHMILI